MSRRGSYLFQRKGSSNWYLKLQYPPKLRETLALVSDKREVKSVLERSLGTPNRVEAEALAAPYIAEHKRLLLAHAARTTAPQSFSREIVRIEMEPGFYTGPDGSMTLATANEITVRAPDGTLTTRPNRKLRHDYQIDPAVLPPSIKRIWEAIERPSKRVKDDDSEIVEAFIVENGKNAEDAKLARDTLAVFKAVNGGKTFAASGRGDVKALIKHLSEAGGRKGTGLKMATIKRAVAQLKAAVNLELKADHPRLVRNVFTTVTIDSEAESDPGISYTEEDVATVRANLDKLDAEERLMWVWHAATGVRPAGIYSIASDDWEEAVDPDTNETYRTRHVRIRKDKDKIRGKKYGPRNLPIPQAVLDMGVLPEKIEHPLFARDRKSLLATLNRKLEIMGVNVNGKTLYGGRHRAVDRMVNREVHPDQRKAILGHARQGIEARYGHGFNMWRLKRAMDRIGA